MTQLVSLQQSKRSQNPIEATFQRLQKKIRRLQKQLGECFKELDEGLDFYKDRIWPAERELVQALQEFILHFYSYLKKTQNFSKKERVILKQIILNKIDDLFAIIPPGEADEKIRLIFKELEGVSCEEVMADEFDRVKREISESFSEHGIELDLSQINSMEEESVIIQKMAEALCNAAENSERLFKPEPKSKKQLEKERKAKELEELQQKGLGSIYKQLVKVFHPDLEQDLELKAEKEELMKNLTVAYERRDLYTLLALQVKWMNRMEGGRHSNPDEQLKIYNSILKDQIKELESRIETAYLDPKYFPIHQYLDREVGNCSFILSRVYWQLKKDVSACSVLNTRLRDHENVSYVRSLIQH